MSEVVLTAIGAVCDELCAKATLLNELDAFAGDGDLGATMKIAAEAVRSELPNLENSTVVETFVRCGGVIAREAPSTAGTLLASALLRARGCAAADGPPSILVAELLDAAVTSIQDRGKAEPGSKTMLDALVPAATAAAECAAASAGPDVTLAAAAEAARAGAEETATMVPKHGRAGWLADRSLGHEDAGARLVAIILAAAAGAAVGSASPAPE